MSHHDSFGKEHLLQIEVAGMLNIFNFVFYKEITFYETYVRLKAALMSKPSVVHVSEIQRWIQHLMKHHISDRYYDIRHINNGSDRQKEKNAHKVSLLSTLTMYTQVKIAAIKLVLG